MLFRLLLIFSIALHSWGQTPAPTAPASSVPAPPLQQQQPTAPGSTTAHEVLQSEQTHVEVKPDKTKKFTLLKTKFEKFLDFINIVAKIKAYAQKAHTQNEKTLNESEDGVFSTTVRPRALTKQAKEVQEKLDRIQQEKLKQIDQVESKLGN